MDFDEALVTLWDAGLESVGSAEDLLPPGMLPQAHRALGLATARELTDPKHWRATLKLDEDEWQALLARLQIPMSPTARRLPKGALAKLQRHARTVEANSSISRQPRSLSDPVPESPPLVWRTVGKERDHTCLSADDINVIHETLVEEFANTDDPFGDPHGVRDWHLLESSAFRPQTTFGDTRKYESVEMAAAALLHSIIHNHPFHNGNKRTALVAMLVVLDQHDLMLVCHEEALFRFVLRVSQHGLAPVGVNALADREVLEIASWIRQNSRRITRGERPIKWLRLRKILNGFGCTLEPAPGVGNRINISREITESRLFRRRRIILRTQVAYGDEGREVDRNTLHKIRRDLALDEESGVDSDAFYVDSQSPRDFIFRYQRTLKRLAKL